MGFINKDRQVESLVEKLCNRFTKTDDVKSWRDISYCLSNLPFTGEKPVKKLVDSSKSYKSIMHDAEVYENFSLIVAKARKNKGATNALVDELEATLNDLHNGIDMREAENIKPKKRVTRKKKAAVIVESSEESYDSE